MNVIDVNDNAPMFPLSQYIVQGIEETIGRGTDIIQGSSTLPRALCTSGYMLFMHPPVTGGGGIVTGSAARPSVCYPLTPILVDAIYLYLVGDLNET